MWGKMWESVRVSVEGVEKCVGVGGSERRCEERGDVGSVNKSGGGVGECGKVC